MKRRLFSTVLALTAVASFTACAQSPARSFAPPSPATLDRLGGLMQISVVDRASGAELPIYRARGEYWVAGRPGARYAIRARNAMGERVMAVMSVDGVNVVTGETAGVLQNGYVFSGRERSDIAGWRKSDSQIAAFEFAASDNSYASRTGRPADVGVIGVALFRERMREPLPPPPVIAPSARRESANDHERGSEAPGAAPPVPAAPAQAAPSAKAAPADSAVAAESSARGSLSRDRAPSLGTAHGRRETSVIGHTEFERAQSSPDEVIRIRYDSRDNLVAMSVIPVTPPPRWPRPSGPSAFPGNETGYVPDPPPRD